MPTLNGSEMSLSYVQCFLYLVSSSINVSLFILHGCIPSRQIFIIELYSQNLYNFLTNVAPIIQLKRDSAQVCNIYLFNCNVVTLNCIRQILENAERARF